ncbi:MAG: class I SAM-dependent methyltransferase [Methylophilaceae bacterium]
MAWDPIWEEVFRSQAWGKYPGEDLIRFVARNFYRAVDRKSLRILEVGCGPGANLWYLAREGFGFCGVDGSATAIEQAAQRLDAECPGWRDYGELHVGDITQLPFSENTFDAVIDNEAISCNTYEASEAIYLEMARVCKQNGKLFSRTFAEGSWGDGTGEPAGHHAWRCSEGPLVGKGVVRFSTLEEIPALVKGFTIKSVERLAWTVEARTHEIAEWIILAEKSS